MFRPRASCCSLAALCLGLAGCAPARGQTRLDRTTWPNSDEWLCFNAWMEPPQIRLLTTPSGPLLASSFIWTAVSEPARDGPDGYERLIAAIRRVRPDARIGRRLSACTVKPQVDSEPAGNIPRELVADAVLDDVAMGIADRHFIDIRRPDVRERLARYMVESTPPQANFLALDSVLFQFAGNPKGTDRSEWHEAGFKLVEAVYRRAKAAGLPLVINPTGRPEDTWARAADHCDGFLNEMPIHRKLRDKPERLERELAAYRAVLDRGKLVGLIPQVHGQPDDVKRTEARLVAAAAMLIREPGDALFVAPMQWKPELDEWMTWPQRCGRPAGKCQRDGPRFSRKFEHATLTVDFAAGVVRLEH